MGNADSEEKQSSSERIDKWLWSARFYKTRSLAADAVLRGKVEVNGERIKRAKGVIAGDMVSVRMGPFVTTVRVRALASKRGSAAQAALLYEETEESRAAREHVRAQMATMPFRDAGEGKPSKKERRQLRSLKDGEG
jgi:ribosome-associated heat shock protein Hsp15